MSDNAQVLPNAYGMPYCWVFDNKGNTLLVKTAEGNDINLNELITDFKYKYDEENDDECTITIKVITTAQLNDPRFKIDTTLKVQWGYMLPKGGIIKSVARLIAIRDVDTDYKSDSISLTLKCTDLVSYLKNIRYNNTSDKDNYWEWIQEVLTDQFVAARTIRNKVVYVKSTKSTLQGVNAVPFDQQVLKQTKQEYYAEVLRDNKIDPTGKVIVGPILPDGSIGVKDQDEVITGKGKAIYQEMQDRLNSSPDGPAYINSKDNVVEILTREFNQSNYRNFTYAQGTGELIEFKPTSNVVTVNGDETEDNFLNPETKNLESNKSGKISDFGDIPEGLTRYDIIRFAEKAKAVFEYNATHKEQIPFDKVTFVKTQISKNPTSSAVNNDGTTRVAVDGFAWNKQLTFSTKTILSLPFFKREKREYFMKNFIEKKLQRKFQANCKIIGDPSIITSKVYGFFGLRDFDNGKWYCVSCEHSINPNQGYITTMELIKKPQVISTVYERRENNFEGEQQAAPEYKQDDLFFTDDNGNAFNYTGPDEGDISQRIASQEASEKFYQNDNDIYFQSKSEIDNLKPVINSNYV